MTTLTPDFENWSVKPFVSSTAFSVLAYQFFGRVVRTMTIREFLQVMSSQTDLQLDAIRGIGMKTVADMRNSEKIIKQIFYPEPAPVPDPVPSNSLEPQDGRPFPAYEFLVKLGERFPSRGIPDAYGYMDTVVAFNEKDWEKVQKTLSSVF